MRQTVFCFLLFSCQILYINSSIESQSYQIERNYGYWSDTISAQPQILPDDPSQYFLCGFAFRQMKWQKPLWNCNCQNTFENLKYVWKCEWCINTFWTKANAFRATFCHYSDWNKKITKTFLTGNTDSRNWRTFNCPKDRYINRVAGKLGRQHQTDTGFVGMYAQCSNLNLIEYTKLRDNYNHPLTETSTNQDFDFVSGFKIKYIPNGELTGISWIFQTMAVISNIQIEYEKPSSLSPTTRTIESAFVSNNEMNISQKRLALKKPFSFVNVWTAQPSYFKDYIVDNKTTNVRPPNLNPNIPEQQYTPQRQEPFGFNRPIKTIYDTQTEIVIAVSPRTVLEASTIVDEQNSNLAYSAEITYSNMFTGQFLSSKSIKGTWNGTLASPVKTLFKEVALDKIMNPAQYYKYEPFGNADTTSFAWSGKIGCQDRGTKTSVEPPVGYWLVGLKTRCGFHVDKLVFVYSSAQSDLSEKGPFGGEGGGSYEFISDYKNQEWIKKIQIWTHPNALNGIQVTTNKGKVSYVCGRAQGPTYVFDSKWFKRFQINSSNLVFNLNLEYKIL